ncbi:hypothetical protein AB0K00_14825 [Dactylosporangium sp. NPDC049525]|uniref:hypothetical protein n=1 Tax=Dactylosporangium sp. NPDC049525 TaxID=3154730 RepID=UPI0034268892
MTDTATAIDTEVLFELIDGGDLDALAAALAGLGAKDRAALLPALDAHRPAWAVPEPVVVPEPEIDNGVMVLRAHAGAAPIGGAPPRRADDLDEETVRRQEQIRRNGAGWQLRQEAAEAARRCNARRHAAYSLAVIACVGTTADVVKRLHVPWTYPQPRPVPESVPGLLRIRGAGWCATLGRGMLRRVRSRTAADHWPFTEALLRAVGAPPPGEPAAVACYVVTPRTPSLQAFLAADPWFDRMLPHIFDDDQVAAAFAGRGLVLDWPLALLRLTEAGRVERDTLIAGCLRRLRTGGRPGLLRAYLGMLKHLAAGPAELAAHRQELTGLLAVPLPTIAEHAHTSLQDLHRAAPLDPATLTEVTAAMLGRPEKKLVRAHLGWLRRLPLEDLMDGLVVGLHHPAADLAEATLDLIEPRLPDLPVPALDRLRDELPALEGAVAHRLAALLGAAAPAPAPVAALVAALPAAFPPPLDLGALAEDLATALREGDGDPVRHELMLDGLLRAARDDRTAAARVLAPLMPQWPGMWPDLIAAVTGSTAPAPYDDRHARRYDTTLGVFIRRRSTELAARLAKDPPPALLATPATVAGHVDPDRVLGLLRLAERDGWQPGPADLTQALLRLPRTVDAAVYAAAARLTSPAGRRFADWLAGPAEPRTWIEEVPHLAYFPARRIAMLDPGGLPAELADPDTATDRVRNTYHQPELGLWPMVAPSHREATAAHIQPFVVAPTGRPGTTFLDGLATADGPTGPAMSLILAYTLAADRQRMRLAATDALIALAARPGWDSTGVGAEIGALAGTDRIVLRRTVQPLADALNAGAHDAVWQVTTAALPGLLAVNPRSGLADIIDLATAAAGGRPLDLPALAALATRPGRALLVEAARRLMAATDRR